MPRVLILGFITMYCMHKQNCVWFRTLGECSIGGGAGMCPTHLALCLHRLHQMKSECFFARFSNTHMHPGNIGG